jgi:hypothetical protein
VGAELRLQDTTSQHAAALPRLPRFVFQLSAPQPLPPPRARPQADGHSQCPAWMLAWPYRKQNLLRELLTRRPDIMCLQEVQSDHYK